MRGHGPSYTSNYLLSEELWVSHLPEPSHLLNLPDLLFDTIKYDKFLSHPGGGDTSQGPTKI